MDVLFETTLSSETGDQKYDVSLLNESYLFTLQGGTATFQLRRDHDEWQYDGNVRHDTAIQAMQSLDKYLLAQH